MAVTASIAFAQGANVSAAGVALIGVAGGLLVVSNGSDANVVRWRYEIVDVSSLSSLSIGIVQDGIQPTYLFTPDAPGGYLVHLTTFDEFGNLADDFRVFQVPETNGRIIPPFKSSDKSLNFFIGLVQNERGWAPFMETYLRAFDAQIAVVSTWNLALDLDLTAQPNQNFFTDTTYTFAGMTWRKTRSIGDPNTQLVNGTGLVFHPIASFSSQPNTGSMGGVPALFTSLSQFPGLASVAPDWPIRISARVSQSIPADVAVVIGLVGPLVFVPPILAGTYFYFGKVPTNGFLMGVSGLISGNTVSYTDATEYANSDVIVLEMIKGIGRMSSRGLSGVYSSGWPVNSSLLGDVVDVMGQSGSGGTNRMSGWQLMMGAWFRAGAVTTPTATISRLRIEYRVVG